MEEMSRGREGRWAGSGPTQLGGRSLAALPEAATGCSCGHRLGNGVALPRTMCQALHSIMGHDLPTPCGHGAGGDGVSKAAALRHRTSGAYGKGG